MLNYHTPIYDSITFHLTNDVDNVHYKFSSVCVISYLQFNAVLFNGRSREIFKKKHCIVIFFIQKCIIQNIYLNLHLNDS